MHSFGEASDGAFLMQTHYRTAILLNRDHSRLASFAKSAITTGYRIAQGRGADFQVLPPDYDSFARLLDPDPLILGAGDRLDTGKLRECDLLIWEWGWTEGPANSVLAIRDKVPIPVLLFPGQLDRFWRELDIRTHAIHMKALAVTDAIGVMLEDTSAYYKSVAPSANIFHMPVPVAVEYFSSLAQPAGAKDRNRVLLTIPARFTGASSQMHIATYLAFKELRVRKPKLEGLCFVYSDEERTQCEMIFRELGLSGSIEVSSYLRPIDRYITKINDCYAGLCLSAGLVQGRTALISASIGIPMVLGDDVETHRRLFPGTSIKWYDTANATRLCLKLLEDEEFHAATTKHARIEVAYYDIPRCRQRILDGISPILSRRTKAEHSSECLPLTS